MERPSPRSRDLCYVTNVVVNMGVVDATALVIATWRTTRVSYFQLIGLVSFEDQSICQA